MLSQVTFYIPPDIEAGLLRGDLVQYGGVIRNQSGELFQHLKEIQLPAADKKAAAQVAAMLKSPGVLIPTLVAGAAVVAGTLYAAARRRKPTIVPECVERYNTSLGAYLEAVKEGRLDAGIIDHLISDLDAVMAYSDENGDNIGLDFSTKQAATLIRIVVDSTKQLATTNSINLSELHEEPPAPEGGTVLDLRPRLEVQKKIFTDAA